jgi:DNA repair exonuclease SbcCD ATPase subunit
MKHPIALTFLVPLLCAGLLVAAPPDPEQPPSNTVTAERTVQILWDSGAAPPDIDAALAQLFGPSGAGEIVGRLLKKAPGRRVVVKSPKVEVRDHSCTVGFAVTLASLKDGPMVAREIADELVSRLSAILRDGRQKEVLVRMERVKAETQELASAVEQVRALMRKKQDELRAETGRVDVSVASLQPAVSKLEDERQRLELELAGMEARLEAVQEQFKAATVKAKDEAAADPVIAEIEKAVVAREKLLDLVRKRVDTGMAPPQELARAEAELSDSRIQLLDRRSAAASRGGDALAPLTREMQNLAIDIRDRKARLAQVDKQRKPLVNVGQEFQALEALQDQTATLRRACEDAQTRLREAQRQADATPVDRVIVTNATEVVAQHAQ